MSDLQGNKKIVNGWIFYDWANSVYPLVVTSTIFPTFFEKQTDHVVSFFGMNIINTELYAYMGALSFMIVAFLSPILSGVADYSGNKKRFLQFFCYMGASGCACLALFNPNHLELSFLAFLFASVGFWGSLVFYNAYLPEIAPPEEQDSISARGFAMGYFGSSLLLIVILILGLKEIMPFKYAFVLTAVWWVGFSQITYRRLPNVKSAKQGKATLSHGFKELGKVFKIMRGNRKLKIFLISFFTFSMGVQTVMFVATLFAKTEIDNMPDSGLIISILIIQFIAIAGSFLFSFLSKIMGNVRALMLAIFMWIAACCVAYMIHTTTEFYILAGLVGLVMGGIQSLSRSTYSKLLPETEDHASFFSFYDVAEKVGMTIGTLSYGVIVRLTGGMREAVLALVVFFALGFIFLLFMPKGSIEK
ncbi:MAG TPA: MFS transporter [Flavobacteriales bacterium]|nr:MFS transporter [Flavobacteriales bacterium]